MEMSVEVPVTLIQEGETTIAYAPVLDLSTCGSNQKEALEMFNDAVKIYFDDLVDNNTVDEVLSGLGWTKGHNVQEGWVPPKISQKSVQVKIPATA